MALKTGNRHQTTFLPACVEEFVGEDDPVRVYDAFIDALVLEELGIRIDPRKVGNSPYDPVSMLKLLVYGYSYGWRSSRKLERALHHNLSFIWLTGGLKPDHKTIANFRRNNKKALKNALKQCARLCIKLGLIDGNTLFIDGTKIRGSSSINKTKSKRYWEKQLGEIDSRIEILFKECEGVDQEESGSLIKVNQDLKKAENLREKIKSALSKMEKEGKTKVNVTDPDSINFKGRQGSHSGYNGQITTDEKNGLIVNADVVNESNDLNQFSNQVEQANEVLLKPCSQACADAGYSKVDNLKETVENGINVIVPSQQQAIHSPKENPFDKEKFQYNKNQNQYICPERKVLEYSHYSKTKKQILYRFKKKIPCINCQHWGVCTTSQRGRSIIRLFNEDVKELLEKRYDSEEGQAVYKKRKEKVEAVFGHIKRTLNGSTFLVRGLESVKAEFSIFATCYNVTRMITLQGGTISLVKQLKAISPRE